jgi:hypothetical protein
MATVDPSDLYSYFTGIGATPNEATMLTSAAGAESSYNPGATHDKDADGNPTGYGMWGHRLERRDAMFDAAGTTTPSWQQQASFALHDLRSRPESALVNQAKTPQQLTVAQMYYERPRGFTADAPENGDNFGGRLKLTQNIAAGKFSGSPTGAATLDPTDQNNTIDPAAHAAAHAQWQDILAASQPQGGAQGQQQPLKPAQAPQGQTPALDIHGSPGGALASGVMQGMGPANGAASPLQKLLFGNGPTPASSIQSAIGNAGGPNGLLGRLLQPQAASVASAATPAPALAANPSLPVNDAPLPPVRPAGLGADPSQAAGVASLPGGNGGGLAALGSLFGLG